MLWRASCIRTLKHHLFFPDSNKIQTENNNNDCTIVKDENTNVSDFPGVTLPVKWEVNWINNLLQQI